MTITLRISFIKKKKRGGREKERPKDSSNVTRITNCTREKAPTSHEMLKALFHYLDFPELLPRVSPHVHPPYMVHVSFILAKEGVNYHDKNNKGRHRLMKVFKGLHCPGDDGTN